MVYGSPGARSGLATSGLRSVLRRRVLGTTWVREIRVNGSSFISAQYKIERHSPELEIHGERSGMWLGTYHVDEELGGA